MSKAPNRPAPVSTEKHITRSLTKFSENLRAARVERGLSASDLARLIWGETVDKNGYTVAKHRDRISVWENGRGVPEPANLQKVSDVLGIPVEELAPDLAMKAVERAPPEISFQMVHGGENLVLLRINTLTSLETAVAIAGLISKDPKSRAISTPGA